MTDGILVIDTESTGLGDDAQVIELGYSRVDRNRAGWYVGAGGSQLFGYEGRLTAEVRAIHHITDAAIANKLPFSETGYEHMSIMEPEKLLAYAAHQADFDRRLIGRAARPDIPWVCTLKCALHLFPELSSHKNGVLRYHLQDLGTIGATFQDELAQPSHRAGPDAYVTSHILWAMLELVDLPQLIEWSSQPRLIRTCPIGKFKGKVWADVELGYLEWMLRQQDMESDLLHAARSEVERRIAARAAE